jgi:hypothetical protein
MTTETIMVSGKTQCYVGPWVSHGGDNLQIWKVAVNILNKQSWTAEKRSSSNLGIGWGIKIPHHKNPACYEMLYASG